MYIPTDLDTLSSVLVKFHSESKNFDLGEIIEDNDVYTSYFCTDINQTNKNNHYLRFIQFKTPNPTLDTKLYFIKTCYTSGICQTPFLMPLRHYITDKELCFVTDYYPYGSLNDIMFKERCTISQTHKNIIALCICYGMMKLHEKGFTHRNLSTKTVYISDMRYPIICGFEFVNNTAMNSKEPRYEAPEAFHGKLNDQRSDVYSFGLLLYELSEEKIIFENYNAQQIISLLETEQRPQFTTKTSESLAKLIEQCWVQNPQKRPTFKQVYEKLADGVVVFANANLDSIQQISLTLSKKQFSNYGMKSEKILQKLQSVRLDPDIENPPNEDDSYTTPPMSYNSDNSNASQTKFPKKAYHKTFRFNYNILENPDHPKLSSYIEEVFDKILQKNDYQALYEVMFPHFSLSSSSIIYSLLQHFLYLSIDDINFLYILFINKFFENPPIVSPKSISMVMDLFALLFMRFATKIDGTKIQRQLRLFIQMRPKDSITLLHIYYKNEGKDNSIYNLYLSNFNVFLTPDSYPQFVTVISNYFHNTQSFRDNNKQHYYSFILESLKNDEPIIVQFAYIAFLIDFDDSQQFDYSILLKHLNDPNTQKYALDVASRIKLPPSKEYFETLLQMTINNNRLAFLTLCSFASMSPDHLRSTTDIDWINKLNEDDTFLILLCASKFTESEQFFNKFIGIREYMYQYFCHFSLKPTMYTPFMQVLSLIIFDHDTFENPIIATMYSQLISSAIFSNNNDIQYCGVMLLWSAAKINYLPDYTNAIPILADLIKNQVKYTYSVIRTLVEVSKYPQTHISLRKNQLVQYFENLINFPQYTEFARTFLTNIQ